MFFLHCTTGSAVRASELNYLTLVSSWKKGRRVHLSDSSMSVSVHCHASTRLLRANKCWLVTSPTQGQAKLRHAPIGSELTSSWRVAIIKKETTEFYFSWRACHLQFTDRRCVPTWPFELGAVFGVLVSSGSSCSQWICLFISPSSPTGELCGFC